MNVNITNDACFVPVMTQEDDDAEENKAEEVSFESEEDEYEYTYVDSDAEEENARQQQLCGIKRNASPSFPLKDPDFRNASTTFPLSKQSAREKSTCPHCQEESHLPVTDCILVEKWRQQEQSNGVLVLNAKLLIPAMKRRIRACALQLDIPQNQAAVRLCQNNWNVHAAMEAVMDEPAAAAAARYQASSGHDDRRHARDEDDEIMNAFHAQMDEFHAAVAMISGNASIVGGVVDEQMGDRLSDAKPAAREDADQTGGNVESESGEEDHAQLMVPILPVEAPAAQPPNALDSRDENRPRGPCRGNDRVDDDDGGENEEEDSNPPAIDQAPDPPVEDTIVAEPRCQICMEDLVDIQQEDLMSMSCDHKFCRDCWRQFVEHAFNNAVLTDEYLQTTCPIPDCNQVVTEMEIEQVAPHLLPEYQNRMLHSFVDGNRETMRWCVGPDCKDQVAVQCRWGLFPRRQNNDNVSVAVCGDCQTQFCFRCGQAPHDDHCEADREPLPVDKNKPVKNCPKCNIRIEKNGGCNHMRCKCGCHFCWICLEADTDYNHFCGRERIGGNGDGAIDEIARRRQAMRAIIDEPVNLDYIVSALQEEESDVDELDAEQVAAAIEEKKEMDRRAHYMTRFIAHEEGQRFATEQCDLLLEGRAVDFARASDLKSANDTDFLGAANERLVAARRILKWSYCYVYYLPDEDENSMTSQKGLFQNHQERLERFTENLSNISENALSYDDRAKIVNLVRPLCTLPSSYFFLSNYSHVCVLLIAQISVIDQCMTIICEFEEFGAKYVAPK